MKTNTYHNSQARCISGTWMREMIILLTLVKVESAAMLKLLVDNTRTSLGCQ